MENVVDIADDLGELAMLVRAVEQTCLVAVVDREQRVVYANGRFLELSEYSAEELSGRERGGLFHVPTSSLTDGLWATVQRGKVWRGDIDDVSKNGRPYRLAATVIPQLGDDGRPERYLLVCQQTPTSTPETTVLSDVIEQLAAATGRAHDRAEEASQARDDLEAQTRDLEAKHREEIARHAHLVHTEKLSAIGLMASAVAHEVNNPLAGVMACVDSLADGVVAPERVGEYFATIREALERIRVTVQTLLSYTRPAIVAPPEPVDISLAVDSCKLLLTPLMSRKHVVLNASFAIGEVVVQGRRGELVHALMNVLLNAVQASPRGGVVRLGVERSADTIVVNITDEGPGFDPALIGKLCEPWFTTKAADEGTGLGLSLTQQVMQTHDGELRLIATPSGARVELVFPLPGANL